MIFVKILRVILRNICILRIYKNFQNKYLLLLEIVTFLLLNRFKSIEFF